MASVFGHAVSAIVIGSTGPKKMRTISLFLILITLTILPDADVLGFKYGIAYGSFWGHRGFTHSFFFAGLVAAILTLLFYRRSSHRFWYFLLFFVACASHGMLDGCTSGGKGVAYFSPFENGRHFMPWRPIKVSPIGASNFISEWGWKVIKSEAYYIGIPSMVYLLGLTGFRRIFNKNG